MNAFQSSRAISKIRSVTISILVPLPCTFSTLRSGSGPAPTTRFLQRLGSQLQAALHSTAEQSEHQAGSAVQTDRGGEGGEEEPGLVVRPGHQVGALQPAVQHAGATCRAAGEHPVITRRHFTQETDIRTFTSSYLQFEAGISLKTGRYLLRVQADYRDCSTARDSSGSKGQQAANSSVFTVILNYQDV